jgi:cytochrome c oxidase subunit 3
MTSSAISMDSSTHHESQPHAAYALTAKFGMIVFLTSEAMLFLGLIVGYIVLWITNLPSWLPTTAACYHLQWPVSMMNILMIINTALLLASSWTFHQSEVAIKKDQSGSALGWLTLTTLLGIIFLGGQAYEWWHLKHEGLWFNSGGLYAATFFTLTGFHGAHVAIGILMLIWAWLHLLTGKINSQRHIMFENVGLYWHFVDIVWIFVFTILYIIPFIVYGGQ